jgi:hypothetical protein
MKPIYIASKVKHAHKWKLLQKRGVLFNCAWLNITEEHLNSAAYEKLWDCIIADVKNCAALILYVEKDDVLKGALIEVGVALACGIPIYVIGEAPGTWIHSARVVQCISIEDALNRINFEI